MSNVPQILCGRGRAYRVGEVVDGDVRLADIQCCARGTDIKVRDSCLQGGTAQLRAVRFDVPRPVLLTTLHDTRAAVTTYGASAISGTRLEKQTGSATTLYLGGMSSAIRLAPGRPI